MCMVGREVLTSSFSYSLSEVHKRARWKKHTFPPPWHGNYETKEVLTLLGRSCRRGGGVQKQRGAAGGGGGTEQRGAAGGVTGTEWRGKRWRSSRVSITQSSLGCLIPQIKVSKPKEKSLGSSIRYAPDKDTVGTRVPGRRVSGLQPHRSVLPSFKLLSQSTLVFFLDPWITATAFSFLPRYHIRCPATPPNYGSDFIALLFKAL